MANVTEALANFGVNLLKNVGKEGEDSFFSPTSISMAMSMCFAGSGSSTKQQIQQIFFGGQDEEKVHETMHQLVAFLNEPNQAIQLTSANRLYCEKTFDILQTYQDVLRKTYKSEILSVDFKSNCESVRKDINDWVATTTHEKIKDLIPPNLLSELTRLILVNALYFKGEWAEKFENNRTSEQPFHTSASKTINVQLMRQSSKFQYTETDEFQALSLPYVTYKVRMVFLLPKAKQGLAKMEQHLTGSQLIETIKSMKTYTVNVKIPKMKLEQSFSLNDQLKAMGITDAFDGHKADFSQITGKKDLFISNVVHKAFVEVNEDGTEAAAATVVEMLCGCSFVQNPEPPKEFTADHPFLFAILSSNDNTLLFLGHYYGSSS